MKDPRCCIFLGRNGDDERYQNPDNFLNQFGGYESEDSEDPDDDDEEEVDGRAGTWKTKQVCHIVRSIWV